MNVIEIQSYGAPEVLVPGSRPDPVAGAGELLIRVSASGINRPDVLQRLGNYPVPPGASDIPGLEVAGVVVSGDAAAMAEAGLAVGDRVCALVAGGGYAQLCVAPVAQCLPVPKGLTDIEAASLPETFFTVWSNVFDRGRLQAGETLLIQGGTSGIGVTAIQMAKAAGARVIATSRGADKAAAAKALGADISLDAKSDDLEAQIREAGGADVVLDMVGRDYAALNLNILNAGGRWVVIASLTGPKVEMDLQRIMLKRLTLTGSTLRSRPADEKARLTAAVEATAWPWVASGKVKPPVQAVFALEQAADAHAELEAGGHIGKIVLSV